MNTTAEKRLLAYLADCVIRGEKCDCRTYPGEGINASKVYICSRCEAAAVLKELVNSMREKP